MLSVGMLSLDDDPDIDLAAKVARASAHYEDKHGKPPNVCYAHPGTLGQCEAVAGPVTVLLLETVLPNHYWFGVSDRRSLRQRRRRGQCGCTPLTAVRAQLDEERHARRL